MCIVYVLTMLELNDVKYGKIPFPHKFTCRHTIKHCKYNVDLII